MKISVLATQIKQKGQEQFLPRTKARKKYPLITGILCTLHDFIEIRFKLCKAKMQGGVEWNDESYSESSTWGNSRRRRSSVSRLTPPISLVERRQRNEQFFFPRPINIFATILLPRLPPPPALPHLSLFFPLSLPVSFPPTVIWVIPSRRCVTMGDRCPLLNIQTFPFPTTKMRGVISPYICRRPQPKNYGQRRVEKKNGLHIVRWN